MHTTVNPDVELTSCAVSLLAAAKDATDWGDNDTTMSFFSFPSYKISVYMYSETSL